MTAIGGTIRKVTIDGRSFGVAADNDVNRKLGGFENEIQPNGNNTSRLIKTAINWTISGLQLSIDDSSGDHEFLQERADSLAFFNVTITMASGKVYQGSGQIVGEFQVSSQSATASMDLGGQGRLTPQS